MRWRWIALPDQMVRFGKLRVFQECLTVKARMTADALGFAAKALVVIALGGAATAAYAEPDLGKKACAHEARQLCPAEMRSLSRKRVEACMIAKIEQTSPICHAAMLRIKAEREVATRR